MKSAPFVILLLQLLAFKVSAQEDPLPLPDKPGTWAYEYLNNKNI